MENNHGFNTEKRSPVTIKVFGVGGAGGNAINDMISSDVIQDVEFVAVNTDKQDLDRSFTQLRVVLGDGTGAGSDPEKGKKTAIEAEEKIREQLKGTDMLFITAGMGGGTGTGAAPVIAELAKQMGILTVAIVTKPFLFEGTLKLKNAEEGIENLKKHVDTLIAIPNEKLYELPNLKITLLNAFKEANGILKIGIKGISDLITKEGFINLDFSDVKAVMSNSGIAMLGLGEATGENRVKTATEAALNSPLLENSVKNARKILLNITSSDDFGLHEMKDITDTINERAGTSDIHLIWGVHIDPNIEGIQVSLVATDFKEETEEEVEKNDSNGGHSDKITETEPNITEEFVVPPFFGGNR